MHLITKVISPAALLALSLSSLAAPTNFNPADYAKPIECGDGFQITSTGTCDIAAGLKTSQVECEKNALLVFKANACTVKDGKKAPEPTCKVLDGYKATIKSGACQYTRTTPVSANSDFIGDCFTINLVSPAAGLELGKSYLVTAQSEVASGSDDRTLTLVPGDGWVLRLPPSICAADSPNLKQGNGGSNVNAQAAVQVQASQLFAAGANRRGYTYGLLTMPYKYFADDHKIQAGAPIGPYLGVRFGQAGSGFTVAAAVTLGQVKADTVDPKVKEADGSLKVTGSTDVPALSIAGGVMMDFLKSTTGRPFKIGLFAGKDLISTDASIHYKFNRKTWVAIQFGYDFTDN